MYSFPVTIFAGCKCLLKSGIWKVITTTKRICWIKWMESKLKIEEFNNITDTGTLPIFMACACEFWLHFQGTFFCSSCRVKFSKTFYYGWQRALFCLNKNLSFPKLAIRRPRHRRFCHLWPHRKIWWTSQSRKYLSVTQSCNQLIFNYLATPVWTRQQFVWLCWQYRQTNYYRWCQYCNQNWPSDS